jgi:hypothetical protein
LMHGSNASTPRQPGPPLRCGSAAVASGYTRSSINSTNAKPPRSSPRCSCSCASAHLHAPAPQSATRTGEPARNHPRARARNHSHPGIGNETQADASVFPACGSSRRPHHGGGQEDYHQPPRRVSRCSEDCQDTPAYFDKNLGVSRELVNLGFATRQRGRFA